MSATQLCLIKILMAILERMATNIRNKIKERKREKKRKDCKLTISGFRRALNEVMATPGKKGDNRRQETTITMQTSMMRTQDTKTTGEEQKKAKKEDIGRSNSYPYKKQPTYIQERKRIDQPREGKRTQG